ncbi:hypothetical protein CCYA_CCYA05G1472 [Cyanidiococcus yangmingshanensis]|nr:hypothetical protein CCYA_CCYA05G1472 [Cyanidiococcus yangmingshanensis]
MLGTSVARHKGITEPVSTAAPTPGELRLTRTLEECLHANNLYPSREEQRHRLDVLGALNALVVEWVRRVALAQRLSEDVAEEHGARIFTFGSYRLGVNGPGADVDTLCVVPRFVDRNRYFFGLPDEQGSRAPTQLVLADILRQDERVEELVPVESAYVPVMKLRFMGVEMDLLCAPIALMKIPKNFNILEDAVLRNVDDATQRSLNGVRVTDSILELVPDVDTFRTTLRCVKFWAKRRGIYSNVLGYLGGVAWAMLVARVCQLYPRATSAVVLGAFYRLYSQWQWPKPVKLCPIVRHQHAGLRQLKVWDPSDPRDRRHLMPIITPAYPSMNSTYNVTQSTLRVMMEEFARGQRVCAEIFAAAGPDGASVSAHDWSQLVEPSDFFARYKNYLQIEISASNPEDLKKWRGHVESRLRLLVQRLEMMPHVYVHPWPEAYERSTTVFFYFGLRFETDKIAREEGTQRARIDLNTPVETWLSTPDPRDTRSVPVMFWPERTSDMLVRVSPLKRAQLPEPLRFQRKRTAETREKAAPTELETKKPRIDGSGASSPLVSASSESKP